MIIIGWDVRKLKEHSNLAPKFCENCKEEKPFKLIEEQYWFSIFFIRVFVHDSFYWNVCAECSTGDKVNKIDFDQLKSKKDLLE